MTRLTLTLIIFCSFLVSSYAQETIQLKRARSIQITSAQALVLRKERSGVRVEGNMAYPLQDMVLYRNKRHIALYPVKDLRKLFGKVPVDITTYFAVIRDDFGTDGTYFRQVCSCGSSLNSQEGDMCYITKNQHGHTVCTGGCHGSVEGQTCTISTQIVRPDGSIMYAEY